MKGFTAKSGSSKYDIDLNNKTLRQRGRILYMASPVAAGAINTSRTKVVGTGLYMRSAINRDILGISEDAAREWQKNVEAEFRLWAEKGINCDALGKDNFYSLQKLALKSWLMSGDVFCVIKRGDRSPLNPYTLRLHLIEADRVSTPSKYSGGLGAITTEGKNGSNAIHDGIEVDANGKVIAYHICNKYPDEGLDKATEWVRVEAYGKNTGLPNVLHVMEPERPEQYRGVTMLAPTIEMLLQLRRYTESELTAALVQTYLTAWITTQSDPTEFPLNEVGGGDVMGAPGTQPDDVSYDENEYEMGPGTINHLNPGETVTLGNPNIPTAGFDNFVKVICRMIGSGIEIPYDVLMKEFNASYSASKGALEEMREPVKMKRVSFVADFCQPVYEIWLAEAVATGRIKAPGFFADPKIRAAWCGARWDGPAQTHLDPVKEATANQMAVANGWKTNEQVTREYYGGSWEENVERLNQERSLFEFVPISVDPSLLKDEEEDNAEDN
ncbi:MAG: phage portal protein [Clostridia bacterium]|nr:phage portal protein [Clostridia bacterium]